MLYLHSIIFIFEFNFPQSQLRLCDLRRDSFSWLDTNWPLYPAGGSGGDSEKSEAGREQDARPRARPHARPQQLPAATLLRLPGAEGRAAPPAAAAAAPAARLPAALLRGGLQLHPGQQLRPLLLPHAAVHQRATSHLGEEAGDPTGTHTHQPGLWPLKAVCDSLLALARHRETCCACLLLALSKAGSQSGAASKWTSSMLAPGLLEGAVP